MGAIIAQMWEQIVARRAGRRSRTSFNRVAWWRRCGSKSPCGDVCRIELLAFRAMVWRDCTGGVGGEKVPWQVCRVTNAWLLQSDNGNPALPSPRRAAHGPGRASWAGEGRGPRCASAGRSCLRKRRIGWRCARRRPRPYRASRRRPRPYRAACCRPRPCRANSPLASHVQGRPGALPVPDFRACWI